MSDEKKRVSRTYRLDAEVLDMLTEYAESHGMSNTEAIQMAIRVLCASACEDADTNGAGRNTEEYAGNTGGNTPESPVISSAVEALTEQLRAKDTQISELLGALARAQALNAADKRTELVPASQLPHRSWREWLGGLFGR